MSAARAREAASNQRNDQRLTDADAIISGLRRLLTEPQSSTKAPPGLDKALESPRGETSVSFAQAGFWPLYAYLQASDEINFSILPPGTLDHVVAEISETLPHESVVRRAKQIFLHSDRSLKRCKLLSSYEVVLPFEPKPPTRETTSSKRPRLENNQQLRPLPADPTELPTPILPVNVQTQEEEGVVSVDRDPINQTLPRELPDFHGTNLYEYAWPPARNLPFVFPHKICSKIVKSGDEASLTLSFPSHPAQCHLIMDISTTEVQNLAKELYGVTLRTEDGRRRVVFENGATMDMNGTATFQEASIASLDSLFGQTTGTGVRCSPARMDELAQGAILSKCLSMEISADLERPARLTFMVNAESLDLMLRELWRL